VGRFPLPGLHVCTLLCRVYDAADPFDGRLQQGQRVNPSFECWTDALYSGSATGRPVLRIVGKGISTPITPSSLGAAHRLVPWIWPSARRRKGPIPARPPRMIASAKTATATLPTSSPAADPRGGASVLSRLRDPNFSAVGRPGSARPSTTPQRSPPNDKRNLPKRPPIKARPLLDISSGTRGALCTYERLWRRGRGT
jgi:hypothetical protein